MFHAVDQASLGEMDTLRRSMFVDRARQFIGRHKWSLNLDASGFEVDEYDDALTTYCVVAAGGRHLASVRLRPAATGCMVDRHFPALWNGNAARLRNGVEITRFCASPALSPDDRLTAVSDLLLGLCRHCQRRGIENFFGVVFPSVARVIKQAGWPAEILSAIQDPSGTLLLSQWVPSDLVVWDIQERRELREELWARRREEVVEERRLVA